MNIVTREVHTVEVTASLDAEMIRGLIARAVMTETGIDQTKPGVGFSVFLAGETATVVITRDLIQETQA
jgi:hypothetical protein